MDFSKFRASGDLSDMVVVVGGAENHLHRFPLFAKSEYFCSLARGSGIAATSPSVSIKPRVELHDFPGGQSVFSLVADFCYNMAPVVTKDNVVQLRCAAQMLQMDGPGNLADAADKFLQDTVASAKLNRSCSWLVCLLLNCASVGQLAVTCGVVGTCTEALVDTWLRATSKLSPGPGGQGGEGGGSGDGEGGTGSPGGSSAFTPMKPALNSALLGSGGDVTPVDDVTMMESLARLPEKWFADLLTQARDRGVRLSELAQLAVFYVSKAIDAVGGNDSANRGVVGSSSISSQLHHQHQHHDSIPGGRSGGGMNGHSTPINDSAAHQQQHLDFSASDDLDKDVDSAGHEPGEDGHAPPLTGHAPPLTGHAPPLVSERCVDIGVLLDAVLTILPEEAFNLPSLTMEWLTKVLRIATARGCTCRRFLVQMAADKLTRLPAEDLCLVSPSVLHDIVLEARGDGSQAARACSLVDTYLGHMAKKAVLTAETFRLLATAAPAEGVKRNHDNLYEVLEYVLKAEKDDLSPEQRQELLSTVNFDLVTEQTLQRALDSEFVTPQHVARSALKLCTSLRSELDSVKYIAQMQEEELDKYQNAASPRFSPRLPAFVTSVTSAKIDSDSGFSDACLDSRDKPSSSSTNLVPDAASEHVRAAQSVLSTARSKLARPLYAGHRPYLPTTASSLHHYGLAADRAAVEHDISAQDEVDFRLDRMSFRSLEPRVRSRHVPTYGSSSSHHQRSTYFPYSQRY